MQELSPGPRHIVLAEMAACFLVMLVALWFCDFSLFLDGSPDTQPPLLADDWAITADLLWDQSRPPEDKIEDIFLASWEGRPLRALEYGGILASSRLLGLDGPFWLQLLILAASGTLFAMLCRGIFPGFWSLVAGLLLVLHPGDTTHIWLATMMAKLGILYALGAMVLFVRGHGLWAGLFLAASFLSYELSPLIFVLAPFFKDQGSRRSVWQAFRIFAFVLVGYLAWRFLVFSQAAPDVRRSFAKDQAFSLPQYLKGFWSGSIGVILSSLRMDLLGRPTRLVSTAFWMGVSSFVLVRWPGLIARTPRAFRAGLLWGVLGLLAGAALNFRAAPNGSPGIASRHNIASLCGLALLLTTLLAHWPRLIPMGRARIAAMVAAVMVIAVFGMQRRTIQKQITRASAYQRRVLAEAVTAAGPLPPHTLLILNNPLGHWQHPSAAMSPFVTGHAHEIEAILSLVYDKSIVGFCMQNARDLVRGRITTAAAIEKEAPPFHNILAWDVMTHRETWLRRVPRRTVTEKISPRGPAWDYILGR